jgi:polyisoprenoid-binding protein YceI
MKKFIILGLLVALVAMGIAACTATRTDSVPTVTLATVIPQPVSDSATAATATAVPQSLADVPEGQVYTFRVDPSQTSVEYAVDEVLFGNSQVTRGSTNEVQGEFQLRLVDGKPTIVMSDLQVDLRTLKSDNNLRDAAIQRQWLESAKYPYAVFVAKSVEGLPSDAVQGKSYAFKVTGDMTIRNITKEVTFEGTVSVNGTTLTGEGTTQIYMKDFGFDPPEILGRFTVSDPATITIKGVANLVES